MKREVCLIVAALAAFFSTMPQAKAEDAVTNYCYSIATYDRDGDGYAGLGALDPQDARFAVQGNCPNNTVKEYGDTNDGDRLIHPRRSERAYNNVDDNCNGVIDEPTFRYSSTGDGNTTTSIRLTIDYNHLDVQTASRAGTLYARVWYAKLSDHGNAAVTSYQRAFASDVGHHYTRIRLNDLSAGTVYRARMTFYRQEANGSYTELASTAIRYYSMTDSTNEKVHRRFLMVSKALKEFDDSNRGYVGYRGIVDPDGTRYGAREGEAWCSEFYVWATRDWLEGIAGLDTTEEVGAYFDGYDSFFPTTQLPTTAAPGDFLQLDTDKKNGVNHSGMFLAYNAATNEVFSVEGNVGNEVAIKLRGADFNQNPRVFWMFGWIKNAMMP